MREAEDTILKHIGENGRMTVPELVTVMYPNLEPWRRTTMIGYVWKVCNNLRLYHYLDRVKDGDKVYWTMAA